jgi:penicillin-binding protein 2
MRTSGDDRRRFSRRLLLVGAAQGAVGVIAAARMGQLTVQESARYRLLAEDNRVAERLVAPRRGWILDRRGRPLAMNRPEYRIQLVRDETPNLEATLAELETLLRLPPDELARIRAEAAERPGYLPVAVKLDMAWEEFAAVNVRLPDLPGVLPVRGFKRLYSGGSAYGQILGYMGAPTAEEYQATRNRLLMLPGFKVGKDGIEKALEERLRGRAGARREEVNARGRVVRTLDERPDVPGETIRLTIDRDLQDYAARRLAGEAGAVVVMDVWTGDLLAQVSMPAHDPNALSDGISRAEWAALQEDERLPLVNKATSGAYPPGSTFKMATALAALGAGVGPEDGVVCRGGVRMGSHFFRCTGRHGGISVRRAIAASCNSYFYHFGRTVGVDAIAQAARSLGLGQTYGLPVNSQREGLIPSEQWKRRRLGQDWLPGDTMSAAIGQGYVSATPLQLAVMTARIASGRAVAPRLLAGAAPAPARLLGFDPAHLDLVRDGMDGVVNSGWGTARRMRLRIPGVAMAGKTGTAQAVSRARRGRLRESQLPRRFRNHAWFVAYAPAEAPRYAMAVLVEHGGAGGKAAAPVARDVMTFLFDPPQAIAALMAIEQSRARAIAAQLAAEAAAAAAAGLDGVAGPPAPPAA